jgi:hypothetical protein
MDICLYVLYPMKLYHIKNKIVFFVRLLG